MYCSVEKFYIFVSRYALCVPRFVLFLLGSKVVPLPHGCSRARTWVQKKQETPNLTPNLTPKNHEHKKRHLPSQHQRCKGSKGASRFFGGSINSPLQRVRNSKEGGQEFSFFVQKPPYFRAGYGRKWYLSAYQKYSACKLDGGASVGSNKRNTCDKMSATYIVTSRHKGAETLYKSGKGAKALSKSKKVQRCAAITENLEDTYIFRAMRSLDQRNERKAKRKKWTQFPQGGRLDRETTCKKTDANIAGRIIPCYIGFFILCPHYFVRVFYFIPRASFLYGVFLFYVNSKQWKKVH